MVMKALNLKGAIQLYEILEPYLDEIEDSTILLELALKILHESTANGDGAYARSLALLTGHSLEELSEFSADYNMGLFVDGLKINDIYGIKVLCESLQ